MTDTAEPMLEREVASDFEDASSFARRNPAPPAHSKSQQVSKLLRRGKGATIAELQKATSWQPHSIRAFLSGLRKKGSAITKEQRKAGETAYRLAGKAVAADA